MQVLYWDKKMCNLPKEWKNLEKSNFMQVYKQLNN